MNATAPTSTAWAVSDPESELADTFGRSLVTRARKRKVIQPGSWAHNRFLVIGDSKLGDVYEDYTVTFDGRKYRCSCRDHGYGEFRRLCSHALAVILYRKGHRPELERKAEEQANTGRGMGRAGESAEVDGPPPSASLDASDVDQTDAAADVILPSPTDPMWGEVPLPEWVKEIRAHQWPAVQSVVAAFEHGDRVVILDAPTGAGKTLLAELVRRVMGVRALYVCSTKSLQDQFLKDFPYAKVLKGRANYPTLDKPELFELTDAYGNRRLTADDCIKAMSEMPACVGCPPRETRGLHCVNCHPVKDCPYEVAKREALAADIAVLNTAYFLTEANAVGTFSNALNPGGFGLVIVDEADLLEDELMGQVEVRITPTMQKKFGIGVPERKTVEAAWSEWVRGEAVPKVERALKKIPRASADVKVVRERQRVERLKGRLDRLASEIGEGRWVANDWEREEAIVFKPVRVDGVGVELLWRHGVRFLVMSATVIDPVEFAESLGLSE